jgi:pyruvate kinase
MIKTQTKIIATIGPSSSDKETLRALIREGASVFRLNFSHGTHQEHAGVIENIISLNQELDKHVTILADLQGPKIRIGLVENNAVVLNAGSEVALVTGDLTGTARQLSISYEHFPRDVQPGDAVLLDDGKLKLEVLHTNGRDKVLTRVVYGGILTSRKGVNLPDTKISLPSLTAKDIEDLNFALEYNVDWVALSFVRSAEDLIPLKDIIRRKRKFTRVIAKIEKPEALAHFDQILELSNGIMVARGDLGVEVPFDRVPLIQKELVKKCIEQSKPVIIATQMLESMISNFRPTRAEANDVANAVLDGADAVMLSAETSAGAYPVETVRAMSQIIQWTEHHGFVFNREKEPHPSAVTFLPDSICLNACRLASQAQARAIVVFTFSGYTALKISSHRPQARVFVFTRNKALVRKMSLIWGARAFHAEETKSIDQAIEQSIATLKEQGYIADGDVVVHVGSTPFKDKGQTNMIKLSRV